jgi:hypothetical protein
MSVRYEQSLIEVRTQILLFTEELLMKSPFIIIKPPKRAKRQSVKSPDHRPAVDLELDLDDSDLGLPDVTGFDLPRRDTHSVAAAPGNIPDLSGQP